MSEVEELTVAYEEDGFQVVKELDKAILSKGAWATVLFLYQEWSNAKEEYSAPKVSLRRYRKVKGEYRQQSKFSISSLAQAQAVTEALTRWIAEAGAAQG